MNSGHKVAREICMGFPHQWLQWNGAPKHSGGGWKQGSPARRNEHGEPFGLRPGPRTPGRWGCGDWSQKVTMRGPEARGHGLTRSAARCALSRGKPRYPGPRRKLLGVPLSCPVLTSPLLSNPQELRCTPLHSSPLLLCSPLLSTPLFSAPLRSSPFLACPLFSTPPLPVFQNRLRPRCGSKKQPDFARKFKCSLVSVSCQKGYIARPRGPRFGPKPATSVLLGTRDGSLEGFETRGAPRKRGQPIRSCRPGAVDVPLPSNPGFGVAAARGRPVAEAQEGGLRRAPRLLGACWTVCGLVGAWKRWQAPSRFTGAV